MYPVMIQCYCNYCPAFSPTTAYLLWIHCPEGGTGDYIPPSGPVWETPYPRELTDQHHRAAATIATCIAGEWDPEDVTTQTVLWIPFRSIVVCIIDYAAATTLPAGGGRLWSPYYKDPARDQQ